MSEPEKILRMRTVLQRTGLSRSTIYRKIKDGTFPAQLAISVHGRGWRESAISLWMADPENYAVGERSHATRSATSGLPPA
jgi:prophage regulatory protein